METRTGRIRVLNDLLRTTGLGGDIMLTGGVATLPTAVLNVVLAAVKTFNAFGPDNDPYGEHDFGLLNAAGQTVIFKVDYYDLAMRNHSPDPADSNVTRRVMTIMLANEY